MHASYGTDILFNRDTGICEWMSYIYMRKIQVEFDILHTVRKKLKGSPINKLKRKP